MKTCNSLSSGKTSSYMAIHYPADIEIFACVCIDDYKCAPKDKAILNYCLEKLDGNFIASAEHDKSLKVMMELEQLLGKEIIWVRGMSFDKLIDINSSLPSWKRRFCTTFLKIVPIFEYTYFNFGKVIMNIGFRGDELERLTDNELIKYPTSKNLFGEKRNKWQLIDWREKQYPLAKTFHFEIVKWWRDNHPSITFPKDSNCRGCHHKPEELIKQNWIETPEHLEWFATQEEKKTGRKIHTWKDSRIPYRQIFKINFTEQINFENHTMCNSGHCTD